MATRTHTIDTLIVGQGLAGTALAWELERRGDNFLIVDEGFTQTSSLVAAGLITPVTGMRFTVAEHFDELAEYARQFYQSLEARLSARFFYPQPALRLVYGEEETERFEARADALMQAGHVRRQSNATLSFSGTPTAFEMPRAARLVTPAYLAASRRYFVQHKKLIQGRIDPDEVEVVDQRVKAGDGFPCARRLVFCGGHQDQLNPWLPQQLFNRAKGEILTVRLELTEKRTVHAYKSWLCPSDTDQVFTFGSTYQHDSFAERVTAEARVELLNRLSRFVPGAKEVIAQQYGVRPIGLHRKAFLGRHPSEPRIAWLNGLGSKGALLSPHLAATLSQALLDERPVAAPLTAAYVSDAY